MNEKTKLRSNQLFEMGLKYNGDSYVGSGVNSDVNFHYTEIACDSDSDWDEKIENTKKEMNRRDEIVKSEVPRCNHCGREEVCVGAYPEGCFLENDRDNVDVFSVDKN